MAKAVLSRLGRRAWNIFCFWADDGLLAEGEEGLGELEYDEDDEDEPTAALDDCR